jgi:hypothetical protein
LAVGLTDFEEVDTAGERVKIDDNVHVVCFDRIRRDVLQNLDLAALVMRRTWNRDPSRVGRGDAKYIDPLCCQSVNIIGRGETL